jgi:hypothetical protein
MTRRTFLEAGAAAAVAGAAAANSAERPSGARFVWYDASGEGRNTFALFRKAFTLPGPVESAALHLFADTSYRLFVNGQFVEFGPVRCDPRFPLYDTHEIAPLLRPGRNVIAIEVNFWGLKTFKAMPVRGGMAAWGAVNYRGGRVDLATAAGSWQTTKSRSRARCAPKLSFALPAADLFEQNSAEDGWQTVEFDDSSWGPCTELEKQDSWGELLPRDIPFMSAGAVEIKSALVLPLERNEEWHSFSVPVPHHFADDAGQFSAFVTFSTWLYSPRDQTIPAGVFHGRHWLNGTAVAKGIDAIDRPMRITERWKLNQGWNYLFGSVDAYYDVLDEYFALPRDAGLVFSTDKDPGSPYAFRHSPILKADEHARSLKTKPQPYPADERLDDVGGWIYVKRGDTAQSPCRETSWDQYGDSWESLTPRRLLSLDGLTFRLADYPYGFAILLDLEWMHLALPQVRLRGVRGATLDVIYTERLAPDRQHVQQFSWYPVGDRALCTMDAIEWMPAGPRGARYCLLTVRNPRQDVTLESFRLRTANFPAAGRGRFRCSDPVLTEVWRMCERTQAANMEDAFVDCAGRERGMYIRDTIIQYHVNLATFGYHNLMRRCLQLFGQSPDATGRFRIVYPNTGTYTYNDFALNMVEGYRAYYDATGDDTRVEADWAAIRTNLEYFHKWSDRRSDLLLENLAELGGFGGDSETPKTLGDHSGVSCFFSLSYLLAMQSALRLARAIGKSADGGELERRIGAISANISKAFWDPEARCFRDNRTGATHSLHSNLFAVRAGIVTPEQLAGIRARVGEELRSPFVNGYDPSGGYRVSSHFSFYIFEGLYKAGLVETAESLMRQGWGYFLAHGAKTTPEFFNMEQSLCHAWSASPAYYLSKHVLGIEFPEAPNLDVVRIDVQASSITEAEGAWPHPRGTIDVKWHMADGRRVFDYVSAPAGVKVIGG